MSLVSSAPGSHAAGALKPGGSGGGGGGGKKQGGDEPGKGHYASGGDTETLLWAYDLRSAKSYILEWRMFPTPFRILIGS